MIATHHPTSDKGGSGTVFRILSERRHHGINGTKPSLSDRSEQHAREVKLVLGCQPCE